MGTFAEPAEVRSLTTIQYLLNLSDFQIDELYVIPAERIIEERYNLHLNTENEPTEWAGVFDSTPSEKTKYLDDYRRSVAILVNHIAANPYGERSRSVGGVSSTPAKNFPPRVDALMTKWAEPPQIYRA